MKRFPDFLTGASRGFSRHPATLAAAKHFSGRAALTALCFFVIATAGMRQMDASYRQSIVKEGRYSLVETGARPWRAQDLRVGWTKNGAYVGVADYAVLEALAFGGFALSVLAFLAPAAWLAARRLSKIGAPPPEAEQEERQETPPNGGWLIGPAE
ncbi:hypothetical protein [Methylocystis sp. S23]